MPTRFIKSANCGRHFRGGSRLHDYSQVYSHKHKQVQSVSLLDSRTVDCRRPNEVVPVFGPFGKSNRRDDNGFEAE